MRILMLNNEFPPLGGGTGTVNQAMLQQFDRFGGCEIDLITSALGNVYEKEAFSERIRVYKVPVRNRNIHHSSNRELIEYAARSLCLALKLQRKNPYDLCFAWSAVPAGAVALALKRLRGLRYIVRVCGPDIPGFERRYQMIHSVIAPLIRRVWRGAEQVIAKSHGEIDLIRAADHRVNALLVPLRIVQHELREFERLLHADAAGAERALVLLVQRLRRRIVQVHQVGIREHHLDQPERVVGARVLHELVRRQPRGAVLVPVD